MASAARDKIEAGELCGEPLRRPRVVVAQPVPRDAEVSSGSPLEVLLDRRQQLARELAEVEDTIWRKKMTAEGSSSPANEVLRIKEACARMRWSYSWAVKHWRELGGFKDSDGGLKIRAAALARRGVTG